MDKTGTFHVIVTASYGQVTDHSFPLPTGAEETETLIREIVAQVVKGMTGQSPVVMLNNPSVIYKSACIVSVQFEGQPPHSDIAESINSISAGFLRDRN